MLERLGRGAARHHWVVISLWVVVAIVLGVFAQRSDGKTRDVFTIPGTESQQAADLLQQRFPQANGATAQVVFHSPSGVVSQTAYAAAISETVQNLQGLHGTIGVTNPLTPSFSGDVSSDQTIAYATVAFGQVVTELPKTTFDDLKAAAQPAVAAGLDVQYGGAVVDYFNQPQSSISEHADDIGLLIAIVILLVSLGSVVSMAMPILLALFALTCSSLLLEIIEAHATIGQVAPILGTMIALGVGIDYSLFILTRFREAYATPGPTFGDVRESVGSRRSSRRGRRQEIPMHAGPGRRRTRRAPRW